MPVLDDFRRKFYDCWGGVPEQHTHKHTIQTSSIFIENLGVHELFQDFRVVKISQNTHRTRCTELTTHRTSDLRGYTAGRSIRVRNKYALDLMIVVRSNEHLYSSVLRDVRFHHLRTKDLKGFKNLLNHIFWKRIIFTQSFHRFDFEFGHRRILDRGLFPDHTIEILHMSRFPSICIYKTCQCRFIEN